MFFAQMKGEPDLLPAACRAARDNKRVCYPRSDAVARAITPVYVRDPETGLEENPYHPQPKGGAPVGPEELDAVLVPGIAFDERGGRLGRGHGVFDRFLRRLRPAAVKIGVGYETQVFGELAVDEHDVAIDVLITEAKVRRFHEQGIGIRRV